MTPAEREKLLLRYFGSLAPSAAIAIAALVSPRSSAREFRRAAEEKNQALDEELR